LSYATYTMTAEKLEKIRKHAAGTENLSFNVKDCHYCGHKSILIYEDARGHVQAKCKICGEESLYNVLLRRSRSFYYNPVR